jgi:hypothetical protein
MKTRSGRWLMRGWQRAGAITDRVKALDYFRARIVAADAERPPALRKLSVLAEIIRTWPGARFVQFIDE